MHYWIRFKLNLNFYQNRFWSYFHAKMACFSIIFPSRQIMNRKLFKNKKKFGPIALENCFLGPSMVQKFQFIFPKMWNSHVCASLLLQQGLKSISRRCINELQLISEKMRPISVFSDLNDTFYPATGKNVLFSQTSRQFIITNQ